MSDLGCGGPEVARTLDIVSEGGTEVRKVEFDGCFINRGGW